MRSLFIVLMILLPVSLRADPPRVATDIAPVHGIVSAVMADVAVPELLFQADVSPHHASFRPSQARMLAGADLVVWMGPGLSPQLEKVIGSLSESARVIVLPDVTGTQLLDRRIGASFVPHDHGDHDDHEGHEDNDDHAGHEDREGHEDHDGHEDHEGHDDHAAHEDHDGHKEHDDHEGHDDHKEHADHEEHDGHEDDEGHDHAGHDGHDHGTDGIDPHSWLDPQNAANWAIQLATILAELDPENAQKYVENANTFSAGLKVLEVDIAKQLEGARGKPFVVLHDATQYFEHRFEIEAMGSIAGTDAADPGPARLKSVRDAVAEHGALCIFSEPQPGGKLVDTVAEGHDTRRGVLDPLGLNIATGPVFYEALLQQMADALSDCLDG